MKNSFPQAESVGRDVLLRFSAELDPSDSHRGWNSHAPAGGLNYAPVAFRRALQKFLLSSMESLAKEGLEFRVSSFDPSSFFVIRKDSWAVWDITAHIYDILGRGRPDVISRSRAFSEHRFGAVKVRGKSSVHVGMELSRENDFSAKLTRAEFATNPKPPPTSPKLRASRQRPLPPGNIKLRQNKFGEPRFFGHS